MHEDVFFSPPDSAFSQQTLHGSSGSARVAVETQIWVQMQWQRRWSIWAIFAIASGLKRDEIQPTATWRHGRVNSLLVWSTKLWSKNLVWEGGGQTNTRNSMKKISFLLLHHWMMSCFFLVAKKSFEQFPMSQPLTPLYVKKVVSLEIIVRLWYLSLSWWPTPTIWK